MTPDEGFLASIIADPDADAARLLYAVYLEEHGQPERAEFFRVQCALARTPEADPRWAGLDGRERQLLVVLLRRWVAARLPQVIEEIADARHDW